MWVLMPKAPCEGSKKLSVFLVKVCFCFLIYMCEGFPFFKGNSFFFERNSNYSLLTPPKP